MEIVIKGEPREIAALVVELQAQKKHDVSDVRQVYFGTIDTPKIVLTKDEVEKRDALFFGNDQSKGVSMT